MASFISDVVLDQHTCDICEKYLSVLPIKVLPNGRSVCGRCTKENPNWKLTSSSYIIDEKTMFKCINRYDGCRELLRCSDVEKHENVCIEKRYLCPICPESEEIPTFLLWKHFQNKHKDSVLKYPIILSNLISFSDVLNVFIYRVEDYLFYFYLILNRVENVIKVKVAFIGDEELASLISYKFHINLLNESFNICSNNFKCETYNKNNNDGFYKLNIKDFSNFVIEVDLNFSEKSLINVPKTENLQNLENSSNLIKIYIVVSQENSCLVMERCDFSNLFPNIKFTPMTKSLTLKKLHLSSEFKEEYPEYSLTECGFGLVKENKAFFPVCINCNYSWTELYFSKQNKHSLCKTCYNFLLKQNLIDKVDYEEFDSYDLLEYFCSCNCGQTFTYFDCLDHEWEMKKDKIKQKCFKCDEIHNLGDLIEHMKINHAFNGSVETDCNFNLFNCANYLVFVKDQLIFIEKIAHSDRFDVYLHCNKNNQQNITGLLYDYDRKDVLRFENFITVKRNNNCGYWLILICS